MKCPVCNKQVDQLRSAVHNGQYLSERCDKCLSLAKLPADYARKYERDRQREDYRADLIQPWETDYAKIYGADKAREKGWSEESIRKYG